MENIKFYERKRNKRSSLAASFYFYTSGLKPLSLDRKAPVREQYGFKPSGRKPIGFKPRCLQADFNYSVKYILTMG